jgi:hypothetical protein
MSEERRPVIETEIDEFAEILLLKDGEDLPLIIGGHAVGLWGISANFRSEVS